MRTFFRCSYLKKGSWCPLFWYQTNALSLNESDCCTFVRYQLICFYFENLLILVGTGDETQQESPMIWLLLERYIPRVLTDFFRVLWYLVRKKLFKNHIVFTFFSFYDARLVTSQAMFCSIIYKCIHKEEIFLFWPLMTIKQSGLRD